MGCLGVAGDVQGVFCVRNGERNAFACMERHQAFALAPVSETAQVELKGARV